MKTTFKLSFLGLVVGSSLLVSCHKDLDLKPLNDVTSEKVYNTPEGYKQALSRVYSAMATTGNAGPAGEADIPGGGDEGFSDYLRGVWNLQELTTDEAVVGWGDAGLPDIHAGTWTSNNGFIRRTYYRCMFQIILANEFIRECATNKLADRGIPTDARTEIEFYKQEARFLRSFQYWTMMDLFGMAPFVTEADKAGSYLPPQADRKQLFEYIEKELIDLGTKLKAPRTNEYGRADQAAAWALLARLYLNAETYLGAGNSRYSEAITYAQKVIDAGYTLTPDYQRMMTARNNVPAISNEFIFTINYDGLNTKGYGGTHFFVHASIGGQIDPFMFGVNTGWAGLRTTKGLSNLFANIGPSGDNGPDSRAMFFTLGQNVEINSISAFADGLAVTKYRNVNYNPVGSTDSIAYKNDSIAYRIPIGHNFKKGDFVNIKNARPVELNGTYKVGFVSGNILKVKTYKSLGMTGNATSQAVVYSQAKGNDPDQGFVDVDFPLFRLAEMYLIYAEATLRGGNGVRSTALDYINRLRDRAYYNDPAGRIQDADLTLDFILDERARELYWEGHRRTDLIRYNRFVEGTYLWPFKGGVSAGTALPEYRKLFPIPVSDLTANPRLTQNAGY